jgi:hypothetical protein
MSRSRRDGLLLVGSALLLIGAGAGSFLLADELRLSVALPFGFWLGISFVASVAKIFRSRLREPHFILYLIVWGASYVAGFILVVRRFTMLAALPYIALNLFVGIFIAFLLFGIPPGLRKK